MKKAIFLVLAAFIVASECTNEYELLEDEYVDYNCTGPGRQCDGCDRAYICVDIGGNLIPQLVENCKLNDKTCLESTGECTDGENLQCNEIARNYKFQCYQKGMFPHPFFCDQYFICNDSANEDPPEVDSHNCKPGFVYNPLTTLCNKKGDCSSLPPPVKRCEDIGKIGGVEGHPSMYFVCLNRETDDPNKFDLLPDLFLCPDEQIFVNDKCTALESGLDNDGKCLKPGTYYDPENCQKYNDCLNSGVLPTSRACSFGNKFNPVRKVCEAMTC